MAKRETNAPIKVNDEKKGKIEKWKGEEGKKVHYRSGLLIPHFIFLLLSLACSRLTAFFHFVSSSRKNHFTVCDTLQNQNVRLDKKRTSRMYVKMLVLSYCYFASLRHTYDLCSVRQYKAAEERRAERHDKNLSVLKKTAWPKDTKTSVRGVSVQPNKCIKQFANFVFKIVSAVPSTTDTFVCK